MYKQICPNCELPTFDHTRRCAYCKRHLPRKTEKLPPLAGEESLLWRIHHTSLAAKFTLHCKENPFLPFVPSTILYLIAGVISFIVAYYTPLFKMKQLHGILVFFAISNTSGGLVTGGAIALAVLIFGLLHIPFLFLMWEYIDWQSKVLLFVRVMDWWENLHIMLIFLPLFILGIVWIFFLGIAMTAIDHGTPFFLALQDKNIFLFCLSLMVRFLGGEFGALELVCFVLWFIDRKGRR